MHRSCHRSLNPLRGSLGLQHLMVQRGQIYNDRTPSSSCSNIEMILVSPEVTMNVPVDIHQDWPSMKQGANCPAANMLAVKRPVQNPVGRRMRNKNGWLFEQSLQRLKIFMNLFFRLHEHLAYK